MEVSPSMSDRLNDLIQQNLHLTNFNFLFFPTQFNLNNSMMGEIWLNEQGGIPLQIVQTLTTFLQCPFNIVAEAWVVLVQVKIKLKMECCTGILLSGWREVSGEWLYCGRKFLKD